MGGELEKAQPEIKFGTIFVIHYIAMGKSYKKNAYGGWTGAESEKKDKEASHKSFRNREREALKKIMQEEEAEFPERLEEISQVYTFAKDGKQFCGMPDENDPDYDWKLENHKKIKRK